MKRILVSVLSVVLLVTVGCANMTPREQRALSGGAMGAAGGALFGAIIGGSPAIGAGVGGAIGAAAGALWEDIRQGNVKGSLLAVPPLRSAGLRFVNRYS